MSEPEVPFKSGFVTVVGRPNVGKSTLVNRLVGQKVAIVSDKPQTTRNRILAVVNRPGAQLVLFDTPGIHKPEHEMNRRMVDTAVKSIGQGDVVVWVNEVTEPPGPSDAFIERLIKKSGRPVVLALNKIDRIPKPKILPALETWSRVGSFDDIVPLSALKGDNVDRLEQVLLARLPEGQKLYPDDFLTDLPERFFVAEMVRERILYHTRQEIPYVTGVVIESFKEDEKGLLRVEVAILV
ncbi:MAG: GTPase Era, partial [Vicinamibacterales bacterium]